MARNLFRHDPVIGYRFVPHIKGRVRHEGGGYLVRANGAGFRNDREFSKTRTNGMRRILVFGDSNTAGDGVSNGKRFSDLIEAALDGVEVYNFGLPSSGTDQQYLAFREAAAGIEHDLLVLCPMVDNIRRNLQDARVIHSSMSGELALLPKPYFELASGGLQLRNVPVPKGHLPYDEALAADEGGDASRVRSLARVAMRKANTLVPGLRSWSQRVRRIALPQDYNKASSKGWSLMDAILSHWVSEARSPVLLCPIPMFDHVHGNLRAAPYRQRFGEFSARHNVQFLDILGGLRADHEAGVQLRFPHDEHPTVDGHAAIARHMIPAIEAALNSPEHISLETSA